MFLNMLYKWLLTYYSYYYYYDWQWGQVLKYSAKGSTLKVRGQAYVMLKISSQVSFIGVALELESFS